ncbi:SEL1-like repeat protein [Streptomyces sp. NPDC023998]|uniref:tetratricopeptide repeat protein n=1 Tax=Streptomyces sp. NPDC023998 TaxID=3154597 RepID=UPI0033FDC76A
MARNEISGGNQGGPVVQAKTIGSLTIAAAPGQIPRYLRSPSHWPLAGEWEALKAGAHRARPGEDGSKVPPYVARDVDGVLRERIAEGGLVLVVGDSTAGKTRAAFEAVRAVLPGHRVLAPPVGGSLGPAPDAVERAGAPCVVWLDDLERYLGPDGLEPDVLDDFVRLDVPVVATMRVKPYETFSAERDGGVASQVLPLAEVIDLNRLWSADELARAADCEDSRIVDAFAHHGPYGIAEYVAAGPALLQEWRRAWSANGHPRGAALVAAAVDLARAGLRGPYGNDLLAELHEHHLAAGGGPVLRPEPLDDAFAWAARVRHGVTSLLLPADDDRWAPFDYLVDHTESEIPAWVWEAAIGHADEDADRFAVGVNAAQHNAWATAERAWLPLADAGSPTATHNLGVLLSRAGRIDEAEIRYRQAMETGLPEAMHSLADLMADTDRTDEAEALYRRAIEAGHAPAAYNLAIMLDDSLTDEVEVLYRRAMEAGITEAAYNLARLLTHEGRIGEAETLYRQAIEAGDSEAAYNLAGLLTHEGRTGEAEILYRQAIEADVPFAVQNLGLLLVDAGRADEAEALYRQAIANGNDSASFNLAVLLAQDGRTEEAETIFRRHLEDGDPAAANNLGNLFADTGRHAEAESFYREALEMGYLGAAGNLALLLDEMGRHEEAEEFRGQAITNTPPAE